MIAVAFGLATAFVAALHDLRSRTVPNWLTFGAAALGIPVYVLGEALAGARGEELVNAAGMSLLGAIVCALLPAYLVARGGLGRGDLKLFFALGASLGPILAFSSQIYAFAVAAVIAPLFAWRQGKLRQTFANVATLVASFLRKPGAVPAKAAPPAKDMLWMPFAPAIFLGAMLAVLVGCAPAEAKETEATATASAPIVEPAAPTSPKRPRDTAPPPAMSVYDGNAIVEAARMYIGTPYVYGGWDECVPYVMMDCSCLTSWAAWAAGWDLPDDPIGQLSYGTPVDYADLQPGDIVSFDGPAHVGIYSGNGMIVHASDYWGEVAEADMSYIPGYIGATRLW